MRPNTSVNSYDISQSQKVFRINDNKKLKRQLPQQMLYDKEYLYDENIRLKGEILSLKFENKKLNQEHNNFEKLVTKHNENNKEINSLVQQRIKIKEQNKQIQELETQVLDLKRNPLKTKQQEQEIELELLKQEYKKLQLMLSSCIHQETNESQLATVTLKDQLNTQLVTAYKQDNINLATQVAQMQQQIQESQNQVKIMKLEKDKAILKCKDTEKQIDSLNKHLQFIRNELQNQKKVNPQEDLVKQIEDLKNSNNSQARIISSQKKQIEELELKVQEVQHNHDVYKAMENKEKEKLHDRINLLKKQIEEMQNVQNESVSDDIPSAKYIQLQPQQSVRKTLPRVNRYDIAEIISKLKLKLITSDIDYNIQENQLCSGYEENISLDEVCQRLKQYPFDLVQDDALILARYLVEDNNEEFVQYDTQKQQKKFIIKSVYKKLLGEFKLYSQEEKDQIEEFFQQLILKYNSAMESAIKQCISKKKHLGPGLCEQEDFEEALKYCDVSLNNRQRQYIDLLLFRETQQILKISYQWIFSHFKSQQDQ
ncbi:hypothetical protein pb186bvf_003569 [Paramecium bursaria]